MMTTTTTTTMMTMTVNGNYKKNSPLCSAILQPLEGFKSCINHGLVLCPGVNFTWYMPMPDSWKERFRNGQIQKIHFEQAIQIYPSLLALHSMAGDRMCMEPVVALVCLLVAWTCRQPQSLGLAETMARHVKKNLRPCQHHKTEVDEESRERVQADKRKHTLRSWGRWGDWKPPDVDLLVNVYLGAALLTARFKGSHTLTRLPPLLIYIPGPRLGRAPQEWSYSQLLA
ncbi:hypothetical protein KIL84_003288 [Mauremys mutica]|uniref:Uncharacterized protein n=1 Tax=Mauremys mutica TaxID=74926 RepID=A0A9D4ATD3_9SAUR|nr:hypothetical protein KIL84_003288 [Mauremys mutica]